MPEKSPEIKKSLGIRLLRILLKTFLFLLLFFILIVLLIQTAPVQDFIRGKAVAWLQKKLDTRINVGKIYIGLPEKVVLENIYVEDRRKDTLFFGGKIRAGISIFKLLKGNIEINDLLLEDITAKVKRELPDTAFNFQFIIDAFASPEKAPPPGEKKDTANHFTIKGLTLNKVRLVYKDTITGNDAEALVDRFETRISTFDPVHMLFDVPRFMLDGFTARVYQSKPLVSPEPAAKDSAEAKESLSIGLNVKEISLRKINIDYRNDISSLYALLGLQQLLIHPDKIDIENRSIDINDVLLQGTTAAIRLGKTEGAKIVQKETRQEINSQAEAGWKISAASIKLDDNDLQFDNDNNAAIKKGIDYSHLAAENISLAVNKLFYSEDSLSGQITGASLKEKSGLDLQQLETEFTYGNRGASLKNLYLKTPGTELQREAAIRYASAASLQKNLKNAEVDIILQKSKIRVNDILLFVPSLSSQRALANPAATLYINSNIHGRIADLKINELQLSGLNNTNVNIKGTLKGLPDIHTINADLAIQSLQSSRKDILSFIPASSLPQNITIPDDFNLTGTLKGNAENFITRLLLQTNMGSAAIQADGKNITDKTNAAYNARIETKQLQVGILLQQQNLLGPVSAAFTIKGTGMDKATAHAVIDGTVQSAVVKQYNYQNLSLNGSIANQQVTLKAGISDPNIDMMLDVTADLSSSYPSVQLHTVIDSIKTSPLHFTSGEIVYRGNIDADFPVTNPDSLEGRLNISNSLLLMNNQRIKMDTIQLAAGYSDSGNYISLSSDAAFVNMHGRYKLTELGNILRQSITPYFSAGNGDSGKIKSPYDFTLNAKVFNLPVLKTFIPGLTKLDSITLASHFSDNNGWNAKLAAPAIDINNNSVRDFELHGGTAADSLLVVAKVNQFISDSSLAFFNSSVTASARNNKIDFAINLRDKEDKNKYNLKGLFEQPAEGVYVFSLKPDSLLLDYEAWSILPGNRIETGSDYIHADSFILDKEGQQLQLHSITKEKNSPIEVSFSDFKIETLTAFVQPDSSLIGGVLNGKAVVKDVLSSPVFTSDLTVTGLNIHKDTAGNLRLLVNNKIADTYNADITLNGRGNDVRLSGNYYAKEADNNFDLALDLRQLPVTTLQALSGGAIRNASGSVNGKFSIKGNLKQPRVNGELNFVQAAFAPSQLNSRFIIDNEKLQVNEQGLVFNQFSLQDSAGNKLTLNGKAATKNFSNYNFDFTVRANDFQALNSTKKDNQLFYGQLFFSTNLRVKGTEQAPVVDGRLTVNDKTKLTVVLPQEDPGIVDRDGIVVFVDKDAPLNDSLFLEKYDSLNNSSFKGMDLSVNVEIKKEADLTLIVDQGSGDFLNVHGEALLTTGIDPSGKITMAGSYELQEGTYQLTFNLLRRKFNIRKGSRIVWGGEPTQADVSVTAAYEVSTPPLDLVKNELGDMPDYTRNTYLQRLPFQVFLKMTGKLLQPQISFDIVLPEDKEYNVSPDIVGNVRTKLESLRQDEGELNKQVFALLLLNRFVGENPFNSSTSTTAGTLVRQSASKLLTEQLNRLAENLVQGVDLNFDVQSSDDYTTGERKDRTDLNVGLSKKLLNDRLTVTVGSNFELEGPQNSNQNSSNIASNVALNYRLSKDGRYVLRAYRKNEYQGVIDGYIIETGVGFIITLDYNKFRQIFERKKERKRNRENAPGRKKENATTRTPGTGSNLP